MNRVISGHNPTVDKLLTLSGGDIDWLQAAIAKAANGSAVADLKMVVEQLQTWRQERTVIPAEPKEDEIKRLRGALALIWHSTEPDAIRHQSYDDLAKSITKVCEEALAGKFEDEMNAAGVYDRLKGQTA